MNANVFEDASTRYCNYFRQGFKDSGKSRSDFYSDLFADSGIKVMPGDIDFGRISRIFQEKVGPTIDREHFLVWYSVRLLVKAPRAMHPRNSLIADERLEGLYRHFEEAKPLDVKFYQYTSDSSYFNSELKFMRLPRLFLQFLFLDTSRKLVRCHSLLTAVTECPSPSLRPNSTIDISHVAVFRFANDTFIFHAQRTLCRSGEHAPFGVL